MKWALAFLTATAFAGGLAEPTSAQTNCLTIITNLVCADAYAFVGEVSPGACPAGGAPENNIWTILNSVSPCYKMVEQGSGESLIGGGYVTVRGHAPSQCGWNGVTNHQCTTEAVTTFMRNARTGEVCFTVTAKAVAHGVPGVAEDTATGKCN